MARLQFDVGTVEITELVIAGWTARDVAALNEHIEELKAIGVQTPTHVPMYYRIGTELLTQAEEIQVLGDDTTAEAEPVLVGSPDRLWVTVGADHTDRKVESYGVAIAKQVCPKVVAREAWRFEDVEPHWDRLVLRSFVEDGGRRVLYQESPLAALRPARDLIAGWNKGDRRLPAGAALFCGTIACRGAIRSTSRFEMALEDPVLGRKMSHAYRVRTLPVVS
ncbi:MAG: DUF2848 domain-containing protein [Alphaproteobacteria bacterium]|nr:DUF2848 domain-containing protein [Alphaproteobacteria bacterium]